ncbi:hypothetical protein [Polyangium aurulentum]|uniref:hypothetical protein n=1 Tax=Polyangium aurulentum TaxID=2567896 RepID=UPI0010AE7AF9|nr:hypothetical protein [Polyangium aurulentum]UQA61069.1 hypothetical protein E8A73_011560 [Polyangium aurulentum]
MRVALLAVFVSSALLASGCGGTSSETPWPQEPEGKTLGPAGESAPAELDDIREPAPDNDAGSNDSEP